MEIALDPILALALLVTLELLAMKRRMNAKDLIIPAITSQFVPICPHSQEATIAVPALPITLVHPTSFTTPLRMAPTTSLKEDVFSMEPILLFLPRSCLPML